MHRYRPYGKVMRTPTSMIIIWCLAAVRIRICRQREKQWEMETKKQKMRNEQLPPSPPPPTRPCVCDIILWQLKHMSRGGDTIHQLKLCTQHARVYTQLCVSYARMVCVRACVCLHSLLPFLFDRQHFFFVILFPFFFTPLLLSSFTFFRLVELFVVCALSMLSCRMKCVYKFNSCLKSVALLWVAAAVVMLCVRHFFLCLSILSRVFPPMLDKCTHWTPPPPSPSVIRAYIEMPLYGTKICGNSA